MKLGELVARLQELAHEGWAETEVSFWTEGTGILFPEEVEIWLDSDAMKNGYVKVKLNE